MENSKLPFTAISFPPLRPTSGTCPAPGSTATPSSTTARATQESWVSPDCYVALDIDSSSIERFNTYRLWEVGKPPAFVLEIGSPSTATTDLVRKRNLYAQLSISEYWRYDSTGGNFYREPLVGEVLSDGEYRRLDLHHEPDGMVWAHSPALGLDLCWHEGRLRFYNPNSGRWLLTPLEAEDARLAAEARAAELEAELRRLRGQSP